MPPSLASCSGGLHHGTGQCPRVSVVCKQRARRSPTQSLSFWGGVLGAGKTTLIKKLIAEAYAGEQLVLIENEFGEIGIDGGFLQDAGVNITEMNIIKN